MKRFAWIALALLTASVVAFVFARRSANVDDKFQVIGWDTLSGFKYDTYEVLNDVDGGRPFTRSNDIIPPHVKALDGRAVAITGFIMPLRLKKGMVTEFLLFKDQASCCFGPAAKMNHYIRVKLTQDGFPPSDKLIPYTARGLLHVGEINVQGYLTGIYELQAKSVSPDKT